MAKDSAPVEEPVHEDPKDQIKDLGNLLREACRRNNPELLEEVLSSKQCSPELLNTSFGLTQDTALHLAVQNGNWEILDTLSLQDGVEMDPVNADGRTPLHDAANYSNPPDQAVEAAKALNNQSAEEYDPDEDPRMEYWAVSSHMVELLLEAGADPRLKTKGFLKPVDFVRLQGGATPAKAEEGKWGDKIRDMLKEGERSIGMEEDLARQTAHLGAGDYDDDEAGSGPASDSD